MASEERKVTVLLTSTQVIIWAWFGSRAVITAHAHCISPLVVRFGRHNEVREVGASSQRENESEGRRLSLSLYGVYSVLTTSFSLCVW